jgi:hypothetical protein
MDVKEVESWLKTHNKIIQKTVEALAGEDVDGEALISLTKEEIRSLGISLGQTKALVALIEALV